MVILPRPFDPHHRHSFPSPINSPRPRLCWLARPGSRYLAPRLFRHIYHSDYRWPLFRIAPKSSTIETWPTSFDQLKQTVLIPAFCKLTKLLSSVRDSRQSCQSHPASSR